MDIVFRNSRIRKLCNSEKEARSRVGPNCATRLRRRLDELDAASTLEDMRHLPQARCHPLRADRVGQFSVDLDHPRRLVFRAVDDEQARRPDGSLDWSRVTAIEILEVTDTHE